jgi:large subunit ribosomal protein L19
MTKTGTIMDAVEATLTRADLPEFRAGDEVRVHAMISEGGKERVQVFQGVCIHRSNRGRRGTFTVRKVTDGIGVERVWSLSSPRVTSVELVARGKVRRAKLYYLRERSGKSARVRERVGEYGEAAPEGAVADTGTSEPAT